ncbi:MAG: ABC transporter substrate-binding protein [Bacteroidota bacterium]|nr:ABC transporter substrate-binding protein [Bacteroidota bacterium]
MLVQLNFVIPKNSYPLYNYKPYIKTILEAAKIRLKYLLVSKRYQSFYPQLYLVMWITLSVIGCKPDKETKPLQIFKYNQDTDISSLDPAFARNQGNIWAVSQLYNGLVTLNSKLEVAPEIAEKYEISPDGKTYTFYLKKGVKYHDNEVFANGKGREINANDFVYSFYRIIDKKTASPGAWIFNDKVLNVNDSTISDTCFKAVSDYVFRIYLRKSFPPFIQLLTMPYAFVVPKEGIDKWGKEFRNHPVGTGPFKMEIWEEKSALIFAKNEDYWKKGESGEALPKIDRVHISFVNDRNLAFMEFRQGKIDFISGLDENSRDIVFDGNGNIKKEFAEKYNVNILPYMNTEFLGFQLDNTIYKQKDHWFLKKEFRQALNYAINKEQMVQYILNNLGDPGNAGFVPPFMIPATTDGYKYNTEKARNLLNSIQYQSNKSQQKLKLSTISRFPYKEIAEFVQREWSKIGVDIEIETLDNSTLLENTAQGRINFFRASWLGDYSDPENYLACFYSKNFTPSGPNKTRYSNPEFDKLYEQSLNEQDMNVRVKMYQQMDEMLTKDAPVITLWYDKVVRLTQKRVKGLEVNAMNSLILEKVSFE